MQVGEAIQTRLRFPSSSGLTIAFPIVRPPFIPGDKSPSQDERAVGESYS
jgi:hypothetical protein